MLYECGQFTNCTTYHLLCVAHCGVQTFSYLDCILTAHENVTAQAGARPWKAPHFQQLLEDQWADLLSTDL